MAWDSRVWIDRVWTFVGNCRALPGRVGVRVNISPPLNEKEADLLATQLPLGLPRPLRAFLVDGARCCRCTIFWAPPDWNVVKAVIPGQIELYAGPRIVAPAELVELQESNNNAAESFEQYWPDWKLVPQLWRRCTRFMDIGNGDYLGLDTSISNEEAPVVYLSHDEEESTRVIAPSFESFMETWEQLCYVGPEIWMLRPFLDPGTGYLTADTPKAEQLRSLFPFLS